MDKIWAVDGLFYAQRLSGIQRYSAELLRALDELIEPGRVEVVLPPDAQPTSRERSRQNEIRRGMIRFMVLSSSCFFVFLRKLFYNESFIRDRQIVYIRDRQIVYETKGEINYAY